MNIRQLKALCEIVDRGLHVTAAAHATYRSQSSVTRQIQLLEKELGISLFERRHNKLIRLSPHGEKLLTIARRMVLDAETMIRIAQDIVHKGRGSFTIATTNFQARYVLPEAVRQFIEKYPSIALSLRQGTPAQCAELVARGEADVAISTAQELPDELTHVPCYRLHRSVITPSKHPLLRVKPLTLAALAKYPLITYDEAFAGAQVVNKTFLDHGLTPRIALSAVDAEVSNSYVAMGLGIAIHSSIAFDPKINAKLRRIDARHLFKPSDMSLLIRRDSYLREYIFDFMHIFAPHVTRSAIERAISGEDTLLTNHMLPEL